MNNNSILRMYKADINSINYIETVKVAACLEIFQRYTNYGEKSLLFDEINEIYQKVFILPGFKKYSKEELYQVLTALNHVGFISKSISIPETFTSQFLIPDIKIKRYLLNQSIKDKINQQ